MPLSFRCQVGGLPSFLSLVSIHLFSHQLVGSTVCMSSLPRCRPLLVSPRLTPLFVEGRFLTTVYLLGSYSAEHGRPSPGTDLRGSRKHTTSQPGL